MRKDEVGDDHYGCRDLCLFWAVAILGTLVTTATALIYGAIKLVDAIV